MGNRGKVEGGSDPDIQKLEAEYRVLRPSLDRFLISVTRILSGALQPQKNILAVSVQSRVKDWDSIVEKLERKPRLLRGITELSDLVGLRVIVLFRPDVHVAREIIRGTFDVTEEDDKHLKLGQTQFGYVSLHFAVTFSNDWLSTHELFEYSSLDLCGEIQLRTLAEHHWAAAEHALQYKQIANLPPELQRDLTRLAAQLEGIDLEFERIVKSKAAYQRKAARAQVLTVDLLELLLDRVLPAKNKIAEEPYASLMDDLVHFGFVRPKQLSDLLMTHASAVIEEDEESAQNIVEAIAEHPDVSTLFDTEETRRAKEGVYFSHVGLARAALRRELGDAWDFYWSEKKDPPIE
jgi:putative GTP pyrophosphokinase